MRLYAVNTAIMTNLAILQPLETNFIGGGHKGDRALTGEA